MKKNPKISVIIPTMNRPNSLKEVLDSLKSQTFKDFEAVIVEGGDIHKTKELTRRYRIPIVLIKQKKKGLTNAVNEGWENSNGEIVIRTDDDIIATPKWLEEIETTFCKSDIIGGVTGPTIIPDKLKEKRDLFYFQGKMRNNNILWKLIGKIYFGYFLEGEPFAIGKFFKSGAFSLGSNYSTCLKLKQSIEVDHHEACNMAVRKDLLERIGGFDPIFTGVGDYNEADVSFKIRKLGYKLMFNPNAMIYHLPSNAGIFRERANSYTRMLNFINFYFRHIKPNTMDKFLRFNLYLMFLNFYWMYRFFSTFNFYYLTGIIGSLVGLVNIRRIKVYFSS